MDEFGSSVWNVSYKSRVERMYVRDDPRGLMQKGRANKDEIVTVELLTIIVNWDCTKCSRTASCAASAVDPAAISD
jgi:hypothetical protein